MEIIKRQKWENCIQKKRACSYRCCQRVLCKNDRDSFKEKDVVKSKVRGVDLEFDHEKLATILGVPGKNGICEYIKEVWEESKYTKPLEITRRFANDDTIMKARRVKSVEMKPSQRENGIWWIGSGENRRRDDDEEAPEEEAEDENEGNQDDFDWEAVIDEATVEGESGSDDQFYDAQVEVEEPVTETPRRHSEFSLHLRLSRKIKNSQESTLGSY
ncbi:hypothetical protein Dimus_000973 [Dionaea muscipula]